MLITGKTADGRIVDLTHQAKYQSSDPEDRQRQRERLRPWSSGWRRYRGGGCGGEEPEGAGAGRRVAAAARFPLRERHPADPEPLRLQLFGLPRQGGGAERVQALGVRLRPAGRLRRPRRRRRAAGASSRPRRSRACCCARSAARSPHGGGAADPARPRPNTKRCAAGSPPGCRSARARRSERDGGARRAARARAAPCTPASSLRVIARFSDGREIDVTAARQVPVEQRRRWRRVRPIGLVTAGDVPGEGADHGQLHERRRRLPRRSCRAPRRSPTIPTFPTNNFIDRLVSSKLRKLNILPSELCDDASICAASIST